MKNDIDIQISPVTDEEIYNELNKSKGIMLKILIVVLKIGALFLIPIIAFFAFVFQVTGMVVKWILFFIGGLCSLISAIALLQYFVDKENLFIIIYGFMIGFISLILAVFIDAIGEFLLMFLGKTIAFLHY
ncbi:hypothetical protein CS063_01630 [Sporanaerobium hydrogeniformans]|uniref:Uncharacterized protein n=1 Tax=Sporanaerobium hydrogeniformans TaxID=3072179 RepID=A0AC61DHY1_9FIRM|nr:hypothetical protein [Sporanaerobium hydrogeniformans]PHV72201.1 hypothetical protein CS063_01630 [Sporanaerobium hydrogeniformans]